jgi:hypothetical protein
VQRPAERRAAEQCHALARDEPERRHALAGHPGRVDRGDRPDDRSETVEVRFMRSFLLMILIVP